MVNEKLLLKMKTKFEEGPAAASLSDIPLLFKFSKELIADNEELKEDYLDEIINVQIIISDYDNKTFWIRIKDADFDFGEGNIDDASFTITASLLTMSKLIYGENDAVSAYMAGDISVEGNLQDAIAFNEFLEIGLEEFEDLIEELE